MARRPPRFWDEPWFVALAIPTCLPLGLLFLWGSIEVPRHWKAMVSGAILGLALALSGLEHETGWIQEGLSGLGAEVFRGLAEGELAAGRHARAMAWAEVSFGLAPEDRRVCGVGSRVAEAMEDAPARGRWLMLAVRPLAEERRRDPRAVVALGRWALEQGKTRLFETLLGRLGLPEARAVGGSALQAAWANRRGRHEEAEEAARRAIFDFRVAAFAECFAEISASREARGDRLQAGYFALEAFRHDPSEEKHARRALALLADHPAELVPARAFLRAARLRGKVGRGEPEASAVADAILARLVERFPRFVGIDLALHSRASYCFYETKDFDRAAALYQRIVDEFRDRETWCRALYQLVRTHRRREDRKAALAAARRSGDTCPGELAEAIRTMQRQLERE